uniref:Reverse transcriptase domain-containing protein n=1 Tax=Tanacetum cinerariifolium TaxID=118510 RepID=A0A6L2MCP8_TANCI|nr:reverse transcriptase domain-containing protein [Tanacetum cinerariifolium]
MSTRFSSYNLVPPSTNLKSIIRNQRRNLGNPSLLLDFEEINMANDPNNVQGPPVGPNLQNPNPDLRLMEDLLQAPTDGVGDAIVVPPVLANQFELKIGLLNLVTAISFHGFKNDDPHSYICRFTKITQTVKLNQVSHDIIKLILFPFSLEGAARTWLEKEPPNSTWNDLVSKFVNQLFPPSRTTNLRNEITRFQQRFTGGNFLTRNTQEALTIIENKSKVQTSRNKPQASSTSDSTLQNDAITTLSRQVDALSNQISSMNKPIHSIQEGCETYGGPHPYYECQAASGYTQDVYATTGTYNSSGNTYQPQGDQNLLSFCSNNFLGPLGFNQSNNQNQGNNQNYQNRNTQKQNRFNQGSQDQGYNQNSGQNFNQGQMQKDLQERPQGEFPSNTIPNPREEIKSITARSGIIFVKLLVPLPPFFLLLRRLNKEKLQDKYDIQVHKFFQIFKKLHFNISLAEALALMPKYHKMLKDHLSDKEKLLGLANTSLTENCSAVLFKKLPEKLKDPGKFLIPCDFLELEKCMALFDSGANINLMPLSVWKKLMLPKPVPTRMTLELANRSIAYPAGIAEDIFVQVGKLTFSADFLVVDYDIDPRVPLILGRPLLRTARFLIDVYGEELILRDEDEKLIFHAESTTRHPHKHGNDPTPSDLVVDSLVEETNILLSHFSDSSPDYETFCFDIEEKSSGSTTSHSYHSLPVDESFCFDIDHTKEKSSDIPYYESKVHIEVLSVLWRNMLPIPDDSLPLSSRLKGGSNNNNNNSRLIKFVVSCRFAPDVSAFKRVEKITECMQTRSSSRLVSNPSSNLTPFTNPNPKGRNRRRSKQRIEEFNLDELSPPIVMMADQRTMAQFLQAPTEGYEDAIVVPTITADNFELKHGLLTLRFDEYFSEAWDRFKDLLRACPHHGFSKLHQLDTFYNALNSKEDSLNSAAGSNFLDKMPRECLAIIESKSKVHYSRNKPVVSKVSRNASTFGISPDVAELKDMVKALLLDKKSQNQALATVKAVEESCVTCGGAHSYRNCPATDGNVYRDNIQEFVSQAAYALSSGTLPSNTIANPRSDLKAITTQSCVSYDGPQILPPPSFLPKVVENEPEATKDTVHPTNNESTKDVQPQVVQSKSPILTYEPIISPTNEPVTSPFGPSIKILLTNKDKLYELAKTPLNEHCSTVLLKKLPEKLGDPGKFLIPCDFPRKAECLALAALGVTINLMPLSVWNKLSLPDLSPTCMTLELTDRSISRLVGVAEDVYVKVGSFHFSVDFVVIDFDADPRAITFNLDQTSRHSANYNDMTAKRIDVIDIAYEEYSQEVLGFYDVITSGNPTPYYDPIVSTTSLTLTPFGNSDFLLDEVAAFLALDDDHTSPKVDQSYLDSEEDILLLEAFLNDEPSLPPPNQGNYPSEVRKELKICEAKFDKSSIDEPPEVKLKDLPPHLEYTFLEGDNKFPIVIAKDLSVEEKTALITVLKSHKRAITWKLSDIKGIDTEFCTYEILMEEDFEPTVQHQRRVNSKIHDVIKQEVLKLLDAGLIYPISDSTWVCPVHCVPKKDTPFHFSKECVEAFQTLKRKLTKAPILIAPDWDMPFELMCDASDFAIGAVLGQRQDKHFRPIHYASKTMTEAESNYTTTKKEMLAVVYAFEKFRSYLIMNKSIVYTDHSALKYIFAKKDSKARLLRWVLLLQKFTLKVIDTKGAENLATDHLS